jgi:rod shape-determining protein MreB
MVIDIGAGTVDFCVMHGSRWSDDDQRSLITAGDAVDQKLYDLLSERYPESDFTLNVVRRCKEKFGLLNIPRKKAEVEIPVHG